MDQMNSSLVLTLRIGDYDARWDLFCASSLAGSTSTGFREAVKIYLQVLTGNFNLPFFCDATDYSA
jgi:hypothetical protein